MCLIEFARHNPTLCFSDILVYLQQGHMLEPTSHGICKESSVLHSDVLGNAFRQFYTTLPWCFHCVCYLVVVCF